MRAPRTHSSILVAAFALSACGDVRCAPSCSTDMALPAVPATPSAPNGDAGAMCPGPQRSGITACFPSECSPGHYCDDAGTGSCRPGCASDESCGPRELCVREGDAVVGRCEPCLQHPGHDAKPGCVVPARRGTTSCFPGECPVGQRCVDDPMPHCVPGCASDENCGSAEHCVRSDASPVGVCRSCFQD